MPENLKLSLYGNTFCLDCSGAVYWEEKEILLIADLHIGKAHHFRKEGIAVPSDVQYENFTNLSRIIERFEPKEVLFLGDLFHSKRNEEWNYFEDWLSNSLLDFTLILGNHDAHDIKSLISDKLKLIPQLTMDEFIFTHHPLSESEKFNFCGHIHPGFILRGRGKQVLKLPCFAKSSSQLILPSFGSFTGVYPLELKDFDQLYVISETEIFEINGF